MFVGKKAMWASASGTVRCVALCAIVLTQSLPVLAGSAKDRLQALSEQYEKVASVHFKCSFVIQEYGRGVGAEPQPPVTGAYEFWAREACYRQDIQYLYAHRPPRTFQFACNGARRQFLDEEASTFFYTKRRSNVAAAFPPNPMLAAVAFISPPNSAQGGQLLWTDLTRSMWKEILDNLPADQPGARTKTGIVAQVPMGYGQRQFAAVTFDDQHAHIPARITLPPTSDGVTSEIVIEERMRGDIEGQCYHWPSVVCFRAIEGREVVAEFRTRMTLLELNGNVPLDLFTLNFRNARHIYDEDSEVALTPSGGYLPPRGAGSDHAVPAAGGAEASAAGVISPVAPPLRRADHEHRPQGPRWTLLLCLLAGLCGVLAVAAGLYARRRARHDRQN